jgi:RNA polymerase sigma-70 factor (ECF subfamily)
MSSEAACFPDSLARTSEVCAPSHRAPDITSGFPNAIPTQTPTSDCSLPAVIPITEISDELLLEQVGHGTKEALSILFRRHARTVRNVAHRILKDEAEAEDLVQDVFIFLLRKASLFSRSNGSARSWIVHIAYHRAFDRRRHLITRHFYACQDIAQAALTVADRRYETLLHEWSLERIYGKQSAVRLRELLTPSQLMTIELHFFEGYSLEEIAERLDQTLGNVRNHYHRGLEKLRKPAFARKLRSK